MKTEFFAKNRKGNIAILVLVLGVLIISTLALFSFFASNFQVGISFEGVSKVEDLNSKLELNTYSGDKMDGLFREVPGSFFSGEETIFRVQYDSLS